MVRTENLTTSVRRNRGLRKQALRRLQNEKPGLKEEGSRKVGTAKNFILRNAETARTNGKELRSTIVEHPHEGLGLDDFDFSETLSELFAFSAVSDHQV